MGKLPPPMLPPPAPPGVSRNQIKKVVQDLLLASAARVGHELNFIGPGAIALIYAELEAMTTAGELEKAWINNRILFAVKEKP